MTNLEQQLRDAYLAVADRTVVADALTDPRELALADVAALHPPRSRRTLLAIAASVALLATAVVVLLNRRAPEPANHRDEARSIAVPLYVPQGYGYYAAGLLDQPSLVFGFEGRFNAIHFVQYGDARSNLIVVSASSSSQPTRSTGTLTLASGVVAQLTVEPEFAVLAWAQPDGVIVGVQAFNPGISSDELLRIANSIWYVTQPMFAKVISRGGFAELSMDKWQVPGDGSWHAMATVRGSLQQSADETIGNVGWTTIEGCHVSGNGTPQQLILIGPGTTTEFVVTASDGSVHRIPAGHPPGIPTMAFGLSAVDGSIECMGAEP